MASFVKHKTWYTGSQSLVIGLKRGDQVNVFTQPKELNKNIITKDLFK